MIGDLPGREEVIAVLPVGEVVGREVGSIAMLDTVSSFPPAANIPRHDYLIVHTVELHMLQSPPLIDPRRDILFPQPRQVRRVVHANLNAIGPKLGYQRRQQRSARWVRRFARASQRIRQDTEPQLRIPPQRLLQRFDELAFRLANVQCRQKDPGPGISYSILSLIL